MTFFCKYKYSLGKPKEGIHSYRFFGLAIMDVIMTIVLAAIISFFFNLSFLKTSICLFLFGIFCHWLFCVPTTIHKLLFA